MAMLTVVGVFQTPASAYEAVDELKSIRIQKKKINLLVPGDPEKAVKEIPTTEAEQPGMGAAVGGVVGGAFGAAAGVSLGSREHASARGWTNHCNRNSWRGHS